MMVFIKNLWYRTWSNKSRFFVTIGLIIASVALALFVVSHSKFTTKIAIIGEENQIQQTSSELKITYLDKRPDNADLANGTFDAVVTAEDGKLKVNTFKSKKYRQQLENALQGTQKNTGFTEKRQKTGSKILSYMLMFLLMSSVSNAFLFSEDKEKHQLERVVSSPLSFSKLIISYTFFSMLNLFLPAFLLITLLHLLFNVQVGFSLANYAVLLGLITLFGVAFSFCNAAFFKEAEQANMAGSFIMVITTLLSGSFFTLDSGNGLFNRLTKFLPQKQFLDIVNSVANGRSYSSNVFHLSFLIGISLILLMMAIIKVRRNYVST